MDWNRLERGWQQMKGKVKEKWASALMTTSPPYSDAILSEEVRLAGADRRSRLYGVRAADDCDLKSTTGVFRTRGLDINKGMRGRNGFMSCHSSKDRL